MQTERKVTWYEESERETFVRGKQYLMVIGINTYQDFTPLVNAQIDALAVQGLLTKYYGFSPDNQVVLYDSAATLKNITYHLREMVKKVQKEDSLLIYFAGHGYYDRTTKIGYLVPVDGKKGDSNSLFSNSLLRDMLRAINSLHTFLVLDACFSGSLLVARDAEDSSSLAENIEAYPSRMALAAGRIETVVDGYYQENSPFAQAFLKRLQNNEQYKLPASEIIQFVKKAVANNAKQQPCSGVLFETGDLQGEYVFYKEDKKGSTNIASKKVDDGKPSYREPEPSPNWVDKIIDLFKRNKITGIIILLATLIIGVGSVIEAVKSITKLGQKEKEKDTVFVQPIKPEDATQQEIVNKVPKQVEPSKTSETSPTREKTKPTKGEEIPKKTTESPKSENKPEVPAPKPEPAKPQTFVATLTLNATYSEGTIKIDGKAAEILEDNLLIKKIRVPEGNHRISVEVEGKPLCEKQQFFSANTTLNMACR